MTDRQEKELQEIGLIAMASIREMVAALECDYGRLEELRGLLVELGGDRAKMLDEYPDESAKLKELEEEAGDCTDEDDARQRIEEDPLSLEFRSGWITDKEDMEPEEYCLLLATGGPAVRITGDIGHGEASSARLEVQDWGTPWMEYVTTGEDHQALMNYVRCFCME